MFANKTVYGASDELNSSGKSSMNELKNEAQELVFTLMKLCQSFVDYLKANENIPLEESAELFRVLHTLKGLAGIANLPKMVGMIHKVEDFVELVRTEKAILERNTVELISDAQNVFESFFKIYPQPIDPDTEMEIERIENEFDEIVKNHKQQVAEGDSTVPNDIKLEMEAVSKEENALFQKFKDRSEGLFAVKIAKGVYNTINEVKEGKEIDNISRVGDLLFIRQGKEGSLIIFAAELDYAIVSSLLDSEVIVLEKNEKCLQKLGSPWDQFVFQISENKISQKEELKPKEVENVKVVEEKKHEIAAVHAEEEDEDFDAQNLSGEKKFEIPDLDPEMLQDFISNADELIENLSSAMLQLEDDPANKDAIESIFRSAHTIKGTAGMFGFRAIEKLTHKMENIFDRVRKGTLVVNSGLMDGLFFGLDRIRNMFEAIKKNKSSELQINDALEKLKIAISGDGSQSVTGKETEKAEAKKDIPKVENVEKKIPQETSEKNIPQKVEKKKADEKKPESADAAGGTIRVDLKRLDVLVNLVGELVIDRTRFARIEEELRNNGNSELGHSMSESVLLFGRHMNEVQSIIMKIRMVPVGNAFYKFTRVVRDLSKQIGKEIDLHIIGGETELDKTLVEEIGDPLVHLIRNSVDHGIELPEDREKVGKSRRGNIHLKASQDGNMIVITVQDDGKGLQVERIRSKAVERGLLKESDVVSNKEIFSLIFESGFSTAEKVTNISGRGVGMDVVKKSIVKLKGIIELDSELGKGTTTTIKLPLTLAIIPSLMVETKGESYAIPLVNVIESIRIKPDDVQKMGAADFVKLRDRVLPLLRLSEVFELNLMEELLWYSAEDNSRLSSLKSSEKKTTKKEQVSSSDLVNGNIVSLQTSFKQRHSKPRIIFVVVGVGEKRVGLVVDQLQGQQEIVIKSLGTLMGKQRGVAGGCVLGNGRVALVLDVAEIIDDYSQPKMGYKNRAALPI